MAVVASGTTVAGNWVYNTIRRRKILEEGVKRQLDELLVKVDMAAHDILALREDVGRIEGRLDRRIDGKVDRRDCSSCPSRKT